MLGLAREVRLRDLQYNGGEPDFMLAASAATFDKIDRVPAFYGSRHNAGQMFVGKNCSLCTNSNWDVRSKGIK